MRYIYVPDKSSMLFMKYYGLYLLCTKRFKKTTKNNMYTYNIIEMYRASYHFHNDLNCSIN